ncbi:MAG: ZIP family metal transporter [Acetatifactor sp.]|nr:ZIP family metal transporter [Acetatifactor sp.]
MDIVMGLMVPLLGTTVGAACVFFLKKQIAPNLQHIFTGFAAGVMVAASIWSLLTPAMEMCEVRGKWSVVPALSGFLLGIIFFLLVDMLVPHLQRVVSREPEERKSRLGRTTMLTLAVTIHNLPEGAACGAIFAGVLNGDGAVTYAGALTLAIGIAIQNIPEGAIIALPQRSEGSSRLKSFFMGALSGVVEPVGAALAILLASVVTPILPYLLAFAAGAMIYVVVKELIPEASEDKRSNLGTISFAMGFALMMTLDKTL